MAHEFGGWGKYLLVFSIVLWPSARVAFSLTLPEACLKAGAAAAGFRAPITLKNSYVTKELRKDEAAADTKLLAEVATTEKQSQARTLDYIADHDAKRDKIEALRKLHGEASKMKRKDNPTKFDEVHRNINKLQAELGYDYVIQGKGHNAVIAALEALKILKDNPNARIAIVGAEPNFWARMGFSIAVVGDIHGFLEKNGWADFVKSDPLMKEYLERHNGQMAGHFLGKWINDKLLELQASGKVKVTVLTGSFDGMAGRNEARYRNGDLTFSVFTKGKRDSFIMAPGLGAPLELAMISPTGVKEMSSEPAYKASRDGWRLIVNNLEAQDGLANKVRNKESLIDLLAVDKAHAEAHGLKEMTYALTGNGDGAYSVFEGLEAVFRECCAGKPTWEQQREAFGKALGPAKFVWIGKDTLENGWEASRNIPRYHKVAEVMEMMKELGKFEKIEDFVDPVQFHGPTAVPFTMKTQAGGKVLPVQRIFHNNGNRGVTPILDQLYRSVYLDPGSKQKSPERAELLRAMNFQPVFALMDVPDAANPNQMVKRERVVAIRVLDKEGRPVTTISGTGGFLLTMTLFGTLYDTAKKEIRQTPAEFWKGTKFAMEGKDGKKFFDVAKEMWDTNLHLSTWKDGNAPRVFNEYAQNLSGGFERYRYDFLNPAGVKTSSEYMQHLLRLPEQ